MASKFSFSDLSYSWSPELYAGSAALASWSVRMTGVLLLLGGWILAVFAGPFYYNATNPYPTFEEENSAITVHLKGSETDLWPTRIMQDHAGVQGSFSSSQESLVSQPLNFTGCIWSDINQCSKSTHDKYGIAAVMNDGLAYRMHQMYSRLQQHGWVVAARSGSVLFGPPVRRLLRRLRCVVHISDSCDFAARDAAFEDRVDDLVPNFILRCCGGVLCKRLVVRLLRQRNSAGGRE